MINELCDHSLNVLGARLEGRSYAILDWPDYSNTGDHAIWLGAQYLLSSRLSAKCLYQASANKADFGVLRNLPRDTVLLCTGGGNFGDLYPRHQIFREKLITSFLEREIIILPQSVHFTKEENLIKSATVLAQHKRLTILLRDYVSFATMAQHLPQERLALGSDMAFFLIDLIPALSHYFESRRGIEHMFMVREDGEKKPGRAPVPADQKRVDWSGDMVIGGKDLRETANKALHDLRLADTLHSEQDRKTWERVFFGLALISLTKSLGTDRLHGAIIASLLGIDCLFLNNSYDKNKNFYQYWGKHLPQLRFVENVVTSEGWLAR